MPNGFERDAVLVRRAAEASLLQPIAMNTSDNAKESSAGSAESRMDATAGERVAKSQDSRSLRLTEDAHC